MGKRNVGIIATVATALLCGSPGLLGIGIGVIAIFASYAPGSAVNIFGNNDPFTALIFGITALFLGFILVSIPITVGLLTMRDGKRSRTRAARTHPASDSNLSNQGTYANLT